MKAYAEFLDYVLPEVPGCTKEMALFAIKNTVIDFCERSLVWQETHDPITLTQGVIDYELDPPSSTLVTKVMKVFYNGVEIHPVEPDKIAVAAVYNKDYPGAQVEEGSPRGYLQKDPKTLTVYPYPKETEARALTVRVALKPTRAAPYCGDLIYEEYAETIGHGAIARLALSQGKPYFNPQLAGARNLLYTAGLNMARQRATRGNTRAQMQVRMRKI